MIVIDESVVGVWYVDFKQPWDALATLQRFEDAYLVTFVVREYDGEDIKHRHPQQFGKALIPLVQAIQFMRGYVKDLADKHGAVAQWEALRGGRTAEEFGVLLASMPNATARHATPEEAKAFYEKKGRGKSDLQGT